MLDFVQKWKDRITNLVETKFRLLQLEFIERASGAMSFLIFSVLLLLLGFGVFLFIGLGTAEMLSELMHSYISGYMSVAGFYLALLLVLFAMRKKILRKFTSVFISVLTERKEDDDDEEEQDEEEDTPSKNKTK
ncbi:MAG: phage holin family protein [Chitinophagaceae bacterium]